ncbi:MAG TPA: hypothetical protein VIW95_06680 [Candidatus Binatus sp.]|uniref:hypothetical protein n=1 Tax=Candidatus Binatus sp. TaxID=2811406 RepID=UPI002F426DAD
MNHARVELDIGPADVERLHQARGGENREIGHVAKVRFQAVPQRSPFVDIDGAAAHPQIPYRRKFGNRAHQSIGAGQTVGSLGDGKLIVDSVARHLLQALIRKLAPRAVVDLLGARTFELGKQRFSRARHPRHALESAYLGGVQRALDDLFESRCAGQKPGARLVNFEGANALRLGAVLGSRRFVAPLSIDLVFDLPKG